VPSKVKIIDKNELKNLHTGTLIKRRKELLACEESFRLSDRFGNEDEPSPENTGYIEFKDTKAWKHAYQDLIETLSGREHWPSSQERKFNRLDKIKRINSS
jgi:hypothetical protein